MTPTKVRQRVRDIAACKGDNEAAHSMEDDLYRDVIASIATGMCDDPEKVCAEALKTKEIEFVRWCA